MGGLQAPAAGSVGPIKSTSPGSWGAGSGMNGAREEFRGERSAVFWRPKAIWFDVAELSRVGGLTAGAANTGALTAGSLAAGAVNVFWEDGRAAGFDATLF